MGGRRGEWNRRNRRLLVARFNDRSAHVVATLGANRVRRHRIAALRAVSDLTFLDAVVAATFAGTTIAVFALGDSHYWAGGEYVVCISSNLAQQCKNAGSFSSMLDRENLTESSRLACFFTATPGKCLRLVRHDHAQPGLARRQIRELNRLKTGVE